MTAWALVNTALLVWFVQGERAHDVAGLDGRSDAFLWLLGVQTISWALWGLCCNGFVIVEPNGSKVLLVFGSYAGTLRESGFWFVNPLSRRRIVSLRVKTHDGETLKVNDLDGNPVDIAAVVVWRVSDTYRATFEVESYEQFVAMQYETAVRHLASAYSYDRDDSLGTSLRQGADEIGERLTKELQRKLERSGVEVVEAWLSHLAYAPEIAGAMLRRQQAAAIIAARQRIVEGAVGMVELALARLEASGTVDLDAERKASMVSNLMVVLCSEHAVQPVVNAGTVYP